MSNTYYKYEKYQKYINGVPQDEYKQGEIVGEGEYDSLEDCESAVLYRWIDSGETICDGYKLCVKELKEKSTNKGVTWVLTGESRAGTVIKAWASECGCNPIYRWQPIGNTRCHNYSKEEECVYQVSYTMGTTWQDVEPRQTEWRVTEVFSDDCFTEAEPFTFTFDAGDEGEELELNTTVDSLYSYWVGREYLQGQRREWIAEAYTKYVIDWGEGIETDESIRKYSKQGYYNLPNPYNTQKVFNPMLLPNHIYRTGGIKTIRIWGNISYFRCKQVKDFIHWGVPMSQISIPSEQIIESLKSKGTQLCASDGTCYDPAGAGVEGYNNFEWVKTSFTGKGFGTMYSMTFKNLKYFDMSNSPNCTYPNPYSKFNQGNLTTFIADNCTGMIDGPDLSYLGDNESSALKEVSFKNCTSLIRGPIVEMDPSSSYLPMSGSQEVFYNCPNIEELPFTYLVRVRAVSFTDHPKLTRITGILEGDGFTEMCKGLTSLTNIEELTLIGSYFYGAFMDCTNIKQVCTTIIKGVTHLRYMYSNTGIRTLDISKIYQNIDNPDYSDDLYCDSMFSNCLELTTITGSLQDNQRTSYDTRYSNMFDGCSKLTTISPIFKNKTALPDMNYMFNNCDIRTLPNDLFNRTYEESKVNLPMYMFANNIHLTNYPIDNLIPMWKLPPFFFGEITKTHAFSGCIPILADVPKLWGGHSDVSPVKVKVSIPRSDYTIKYMGASGDKDKVIMRSEGATNLGDNQLHFASSGTYEVDIYLTGTNEGAVPSYQKVYIPSEAIELISLGDAYDIDYRTFNSTEQTPPITKIPYGEKFCSNYSSFWRGDSPNWYQINWITDVDDNILENCGNVTQINEYTYGVFGMNLSTEKYTTIFSYLTNLQEIHGLFNWENVSVTSTCGIFKNNPSLTNISTALRNSKLQTIAVDEFSNNKELVNVSYLFDNNTQLTNMPNFKENKKINNFRYAFAGCTNLTGSTPVDENGYKLWERAGKPGYPATIDGFRCFRGCTQLDDYDEIPSNWK